MAGTVSRRGHGDRQVTLHSSLTSAQVEGPQLVGSCPPVRSDECTVSPGSRTFVETRSTAPSWPGASLNVPSADTYLVDVGANLPLVLKGSFSTSMGLRTSAR